MRSLPFLTVLLALATSIRADDPWQLIVDATWQASFPVSIVAELNVTMQKPNDGGTLADFVSGTVRGIAPNDCSTCRDSLVFSTNSSEFKSATFVANGGGPSSVDYQLSLEWPATDQYDAGSFSVDTAKASIVAIHGDWPTDLNSRYLDEWGLARDNRQLTRVPERQAGDADLNGVFDSSDLILVLAAGEYEDVLIRNSIWQTGDWNGDLEFDSADLLLAFAESNYIAHSTAAKLVPEPCGQLLLLVGGVIGLTGRRMSSRRSPAICRLR